MFISLLQHGDQLVQSPAQTNYVLWQTGILVSHDELSILLTLLFYTAASLHLCHSRNLKRRAQFFLEVLSLQ